METILEKLPFLKGVKIDSLKIIASPNDFYEIIKSKLLSAVVVHIACLYFGSGQKSIALLDLIEKRVWSGLITNIIVDRNRNEKDRSLMKLIRERGIDQAFRLIDFSYHRSLPFAANEFLSVYHIKVFIFDDEIILTGANLEDSYFVNRVDRYILIQSKELCQVVYEKIFEATVQKSRHLASSAQSNESLGVDCGARRLSMASTPAAGVDLEAYSPSHTWVMPFDQTQEISIVSSVLGLKWRKMVFATSYLNFPQVYLDLLKNQSFDLFTTSPQTNTFNMFGFLNKIITNIYAYSSYYTICKLPQCALHEYSILGNTFHKKGLWLFNSEYAINIIGSSNFNRRSSETDIEYNFLIATTDKSIIAVLQNECDDLKADSKIVQLKDIRYRRYLLVSMIIFYLLNRYI